MVMRAAPMETIDFFLPLSLFLSLFLSRFFFLLLLSRPYVYFFSLSWHIELQYIRIYEPRRILAFLAGASVLCAAVTVVVVVLAVAAATTRVPYNTAAMAM